MRNNGRGQILSDIFGRKRDEELEQMQHTATHLTAISVQVLVELLDDAGIIEAAEFKKLVANQYRHIEQQAFEEAMRGKA